MREQISAFVKSDIYSRYLQGVVFVGVLAAGAPYMCHCNGWHTVDRLALSSKLVCGGPQLTGAVYVPLQSMPHTRGIGSGYMRSHQRRRRI